MPSLSYSKLFDPISDIISMMESLLAGAYGATTGDQRECFKRIHANCWGLNTLVMDVITALGWENAATRPAVRRRFSALHQPTKTTLEHLAAGYDGALQPEQAEIINFSLQSIQSVARMVNNLQRYSELKHKLFRPQVRDIFGGALMQRTRSILGYFRAKPPHFHYRVSGDEASLAFAFSEILLNTMRYGGVKQENLLLEWQRKSDWVDYSIFDNGLGIKETEQEQIYLPFWQADSESPGLGLGLYLAKAYIVASGGKINLRTKAPGVTVTKISLRSDARHRAHRRFFR